MATTQIQLPAELGEFAATQVADGRFSSVDEYVRALVMADQKQQQILDILGQSTQLAELLEAGLASGPGRTWSPSLLNEIKQQVAGQ